jgi:hypothetical protein
MNGFFPKSIGHIESVRRLTPSSGASMYGDVPPCMHADEKARGQHLYLESDVQMLWSQLQASREAIVLQNKAIESLLTVKKLFEGKA